MRYAVSANFSCSGLVWNCRANVGSAAPNADVSSRSINSALAIAMGRNRDAVGGSGSTGGSSHVFASEIFDTNPRLSMTSVRYQDNARNMLEGRYGAPALVKQP